MAWITIERGDTNEDAQIRYITLGDGVPCGKTECTAVDPDDFHSVKGELDFPVGVASETFSVPIIDHGVQNVSKTIQVSLFGPSPIGMASPHKAVLTILDNDPVTPRDPQNPLALPTSPTTGNPLTGATFFVDPESEAANAARRYPALKTISSQPGTARFGSFSFGHNGVPNIATAVSRYLTRAEVEEPGTVPLLATYRVVHGLCGHASDTPADVASYKGFIDGFAQGIGSYHAVLFLEMDSIITMRMSVPARPGRPRAGAPVRDQHADRELPTPRDLPRRRRRRRAFRPAGGAVPASLGRGEDPGLLPQRHPLRLDLERDPLRRTDLAPHRRQALRRQHRRQRTRATATGRPRSLRATRSSATRPAAGSDRARPPTPAFRTSTCSRGSTIPASLAARASLAHRRRACYWPAYALMLVRNANFNSR